MSWRRRRLMMKPHPIGGIPYNQIWYDAESMASVVAPLAIVNHTFANGRGIITFNRTLTELNAWISNEPVFEKVYLPHSVETLAVRALADCPNLVFVSMPDSITEIGYGAFSGCTALSLDSLPTSLVSIGIQAFYQCHNLALSSLPDGVTYIDNGAFYDCPALALTSLPAGLTSINDLVFTDCSSLAISELPAGINNIGQLAFSGCRGIQSLTIRSVVPPTLGRSAFLQTTFPFYVPAEAVDTYKAASGWSDYASRIFAIPSNNS